LELAKSWRRRADHTLPRLVVIIARVGLSGREGPRRAIQKLIFPSPALSVRGIKQDFKSLYLRRASGCMDTDRGRDKQADQHQHNWRMALAMLIVTQLFDDPEYITVAVWLSRPSRHDLANNEIQK
jgi:hypothetical protein